MKLLLKTHSNSTTRESGFTLVELMLSMGVLSVLILSSMSMVEYLMNAQNTQKFLSGTEYLVEDIRRDLRDTAACTLTLQNIELDASLNLPVDAIKNPNNDVTFGAGSKYVDNSVFVNTMRVLSYQDLLPPAGKLILEINLQNPNDSSGPPELRRTLQINTIKTGTTLSSCSSELRGAEDPWISSTDGANIHMIGSVGIGTSTPLATLHVAGGYIRGQPDCRLVAGPPIADDGSIAQCNQDEYVITGGGRCDNPEVEPLLGGFIHRSNMLPDQDGWHVDCLNADRELAKGVPNTKTTATAFAICCKK